MLCLSVCIFRHVPCTHLSSDTNKVWTTLSYYKINMGKLVAPALRRRPRYVHMSPVHMAVIQNSLVINTVMMASRLETAGWHSNHCNGSSALPACMTHGLRANFWTSELLMSMPGCWCNCTCTKFHIATRSRLNYKERLRTSNLHPQGFDDK